MLNISDNSVADALELEKFKAFGILRKSRIKRLSLFLVSAFLLVIIVCLFLPWTQNIRAKGYVTTLRPEQRPQAIQSVISGRLEEWYVREGDFVNAGDTIVFISEIKDDYFDPQIVDRTSEQVDAKAQSVTSYDDKITALNLQYRALSEGLELKLEQTRNKIIQAKNKISIDSIDLVAFRTNLRIAENQADRVQQLYDKDLKSLTELQEKQLKVQESQAKVVSQENKLLNQRNELINLRIELSAVEREYSDKLAKSQSDQQTALSDKLEAIASTAKLRNLLSTYSQRQQFYHIRAPQSGYITETIKAGIGEIIKDGADIATIMPANYDLAVEIYVRPQDLPLLDLGEGTRIQFDGWPTIVISGWPETSVGVFSGEVVAIDRFISESGFYRVLVKPDESRKAWPEQLRVGTGANTFILLDNVPIWYEIWRQLNGFPANYYEVEDGKKEDKGGDEVKLKAPLKSVK